MIHPHQIQHQLQRIAAKEFHLSWLITWLAIGILIGTAVIPLLS